MAGRRTFGSSLAALLVAFVVFPPLAGAHARLVGTSPPQAAEVASAPARATFAFDEAVASAGPARVQRSDGSASRPAAAHLQAGGKVLAVTLPVHLGRGVWQVTWQITSDDGHLETGTLTFGVGVKPAGFAATIGEQTKTDALLTVGRWLFVLGVLLAAGLAGVRRFLGETADGHPGFGRVLAAVFLLVALGAAIELASLPGAFSTRFGIVGAIAGGLALIGALGAHTAPARAGPGRAVTAIAIVLVCAPALGGHAASPGRIRAVSVPVDLLHTAAAAAWLGSVLWLAAIALSSARGTRAPVAEAARRLAPVAICAIGLVGATGAARAALELRTVSDLWDTRYGTLLLVKTGLLAGIVVIGALSAWRLVPRLPAPRPTAQLTRALVAEAILLVAVTVAVALLGSTTPPRAIAGEPSSGPTIVLGRQAGDLAVGIAATAAGGDRLAVDVSVIDPTGAPARGLTVAVATAADVPRWTPATPCGSGRWCATVAQAPGLRVGVARPRGRTSTVSVALPADPQPARAAQLIATDERRLRALRSLTIHERLSGGSGPALATRFRVQAPDRLAYASRGGGDAIVIGARRWDRSGPGHPWQRSPQEPLRVPALDWGSVRDPALLGSGTVDGRPVWRVSFVDPTVPAWFEVDLDKHSGLQLMVRMIAASHFMQRRYWDFDAPLHIRPPGPGA
jgi:copper transport protein